MQALLSHNNEPMYELKLAFPMLDFYESMLKYNLTYQL